MLDYIPNYEKLRDEAIAKYKKEKKEMWLSLLFLILLNFLVPYLFILVMQQFAFLWKIVGVFFFLIWMPIFLKKWKEPKQNYIYRLHKAVAEMEKIDVYMQIPKEDLHRFDNPFEDLLFQIEKKK